ncbi:ricin-type beta-trefoil lectin domain protein [Micromonospora sp. NBC_01813]|uniref:ricin-type beta-trefoil lectin domain protein n=1 Tax=Micromonospora sp. NBC_01813 TaxID=2975988 RepID=UPI002DDAF743|nr:ricin-type beta-trefoil lectin domain protein [Micromonospora sp. NBC_01813]WSA07751.1 ricin-type beta-trefoil lectin domain protein [Micromonospora sp. NBC_01813]
MLPRSWSIQRLLDQLPRRTTAGVIAGLALLSTMAATIGFGVAAARDDDLTGNPVPAEQLAIILTAAESCPMLTPARIAGQLMAESGLDPGALSTSSGGQGIAGMSDESWRAWAPWVGAERTDPGANVLAMAHQMCYFSGQLRVAEVPGDRWQLSLAAYHLELEEVTGTGGVPDQALTYIERTSGYAAYYGKLAQFTEPGDGLPGNVTREPTAIPDQYVELIVAAGSVCPAVTAPAVAAQLMALSGFDAELIGEYDRQGIAQFRPELWQRFGPADASALAPEAAIAALGTAMCTLVDEFADAGDGAYLMAFAAYHSGIDAVRGTNGTLDEETETLLAAAGRFTEFYATDDRLTGAAPAPTPSGSPSPSPSGSPSASPSGSPSPTPRGAATGAPTPGSPATPTRTTAPPAAPKTTPPPAAPKTTAPPAPVRPSNARQLVGRETGLCVSVGAGTDGTQLTLQRCAENRSQWWEFRSDGTIRANGLCMDVAWGASEDGTAVQVAYCSGNPAQQWQGWQGRSTTLVNPLTGKCLDVDGGGVGSPLVIWFCVGHSKQSFDRR